MKSPNYCVQVASPVPDMQLPIHRVCKKNMDNQQPQWTLRAEFLLPSDTGANFRISVLAL